MFVHKLCVFRNMSRSGLVERAVSIGGESDTSPECLPSLSMLQGLVTRCGMVGEVLARSAPAYIGQVAAIFHNKNEKGFKLLNN